MPSKKSAPPPPSTPSYRFFTWMRSLNIQREPGWIGGVAAGIATRIGIDPIIVRGIIAVVAVLAGPALLVYAAAWLLLPDLDDKIHLEQMLKGDVSPAIGGIGVLLLLSLLPIAPGVWFSGYGAWEVPFWDGNIWRAFGTLALIASAVWLVVWIARRPPSAPSPTSPPTMAQAAPPAPPAPPATASTAEFAAWREHQAEWKAENLAFRKQESADRAEVWRAEQEQKRAEFVAARAAYREERRRTRSIPVLTLLFVGLALFAGGLTANSLKGGELEVTTVVAGLSVALAVLAIGIIVYGILGRRPGATATLAAFALVPLVFFTVFPQNDHFQYANSSAFAPSDGSDDDPDIYVAGGGQVFMNLSEFYGGDLVGEKGSVDDVFLFVLSGDVMVNLPSERYSAVDANVASGVVTVESRLGSDSYGRRSYQQFNESDYDESETLVTLHIYVLNGTITIMNPEYS